MSKARKQWKEESMSKAVEYVNQGGGLREAARLYCVPHETKKTRVGKGGNGM